jgi:hypothetical protein
MKARRFVIKVILGCVWLIAWPTVFIVMRVASESWGENLISAFLSMMVVTPVLWFCYELFTTLFKALILSEYRKLKKEDENDKAMHDAYIQSEFERLTRVDNSSITTADGLQIKS